MKPLEGSKEEKEFWTEQSFVIFLSNCFAQLLLGLHLSDFTVNLEERVGDSSKGMSFLSVITVKLGVNALAKLEGSPLFFIIPSHSYPSAVCTIYYLYTSVSNALAYLSTHFHLPDIK